jgi:peptidoglycan-associated lipoprotein
VKNAIRLYSTVTLMACVFALSGCDKKTETAPPPAAIAPPPAVAPTAHISATPTSIHAGDSIELNWTTTDANNVSISGIGPVAPSGKKMISIEASMTFRLIAKGDGGTSQDTVTITVNVAKEPEPEPVAEKKPVITISDDELFKTNIEDVFFAYDDFSLTDEAKATLAKNADFLSRHPDFPIFIGGYCDERGSVEYNLALGEYRAEATRNALVTGGVWIKRINIMSFGKERPFCSQSNEECWAKNRRGHITPQKQ